MTKQQHKRKRTGFGEYEYCGRIIYRISRIRDVYHPWAISLSGKRFAKLAEAIAYIDKQEDAKQQQESI